MSFSDFILCCIFAFFVWSRYNDASRDKAQEERNVGMEKSMLELSRNIVEGFEETRNYVAALHYSREMKVPLEYQLLNSKIDRLRHDWAVDRAESRRNHRQLSSQSPLANASDDNAYNQASPEHDSPEHDSPEHDSPEHDSPEHDSPEHGSPNHDTSDPDASNIEDDDDRIKEYLRNTARKTPEATANTKNNAPTAEDHSLNGKGVAGKARDTDTGDSPLEKGGGEVVSEIVLSTTGDCDVAGEEASFAAAEDSEAIAEDTYCASEGSRTLVEESPVTTKSIDVTSVNLVPLSASSDPPAVEIPAPSTQHYELSEDDDDSSDFEWQLEESDSESTAMSSSNDYAEAVMETGKQTTHALVRPISEQALSTPAKQRRHVHFSNEIQRHGDVLMNTTTFGVEQQSVSPQTDEHNIEQHVEKSVRLPSEYQAIEQPLEQRMEQAVEQPTEYQSIAYLPIEYQQTEQTAPRVAPADYSLLQPLSAEPPMAIQVPSSLNNVDMIDAPVLDVEEICHGSVRSTQQQGYGPSSNLSQPLPVHDYVYLSAPQACRERFPPQQEATVYQANAPAPQHFDPVPATQQAAVNQPTIRAPEPGVEPSSVNVTPTEHGTPDVALGGVIITVSVPDNSSATPTIDRAVAAALVAVVKTYEDDIVGTRLTDLNDYMDVYMDASELVGDLSDIEYDVKSGAITTQEQLEDKLKEHLKGIEKVEADHEATVVKEAREAQKAYDQWLHEHPWYAEVLGIYETYWRDVGGRIDGAGERESYEKIRMALVNQQIKTPDAMRAALEQHWQKVLEYEAPATKAAEKKVVVVEDEVNSQWSEYFAEILGKRKPASKGGPIKRCWREYDWNVVLDDFYEPEPEFHQGFEKEKADHVELDNVQPGTVLADIMKDCVDSMNMD